MLPSDPATRAEARQASTENLKRAFRVPWPRLRGHVCFAIQARRASEGIERETHLLALRACVFRAWYPDQHAASNLLGLSLFGPRPIARSLHGARPIPIRSLALFGWHAWTKLFGQEPVRGNVTCVLPIAHGQAG